MVNIKAKAGLKSSIIIQNLDIHYFRSHFFSNTTFVIKIQIQKTIIKKSYIKKFGPKKTKLADSKTFTLSCFNKAIKPNCQKKKSIRRKNKIRTILFWPSKIILLKIVMNRKKVTKSIIIA